MDPIGIDVHKKDGEMCILAEGGELIEQRIRTEPERFAVVRGDRPRARIVIEAATAYAAHPERFPVQRCGGWRSAGVLLRVYARWMPQDGADVVQDRAAVTTSARAT